MFRRFFLPLGNVFVSLILGALALGVGLSYFPDATLRVFTWAGSLRETLITDGWTTRYERLLRALLDERQIVYMGFVLATRALVGLLMLLLFRLAGGSQEPEFPI